MAASTSAPAADAHLGAATSSGVVAAIDVGATRIKAAIIAADGRRLVEVRRPTRRSEGPSAVLQLVGDIAADLIARPDHGTDTSADILAVGVAVCGTVDRAGRVSSVNLGWASTDVGGALSGRLGIPVTVLNDAHAGAIGERDFGAARGIGDFVYVSLGTGIGAALVQDGRVLGGTHGHAGELGHIRVESPGRLCACGARGCLETIMSAAAIEGRWLEVHGEPMTARQIIEHVVARDHVAGFVWEPAVEALAAGLLTTMSLVDPGTVVFGGGLSSAGAGLIDPLAASLRAQASSFHVVAELRLASLGDWSGCAGAASEAYARISQPA